MPYLPRKAMTPSKQSQSGGIYWNGTQSNSSDILLTIKVDEEIGDTIFNITIENLGGENLTTKNGPFLTSSFSTMSPTSLSIPLEPTAATLSTINSVSTPLVPSSTMLPSATGSTLASASPSATSTQGSISLIIVLFRALFGGN